MFLKFACVAALGSARAGGGLRSAAFVALSALLAYPALAAAAEPSLTIELNKLEARDATTPTAPAETAKETPESAPAAASGKSCRAYLLIANEGTTEYQAFKLDLVQFQTDGVIGRRFAIDLAPIKPSKRKVRLFDIDGVACNEIGSFLVNDIVECKADAAPAEDCLSRITVKSIVSNVTLTK